MQRELIAVPTLTQRNVRVVTAGPQSTVLFNALRGIERAYPNDRPNVVGVAKGIGMPWATCYRILEDWAHIGWWEYGASIRTGWLSERAPYALVARR